ncbi:MAG: SRPBCC family protein [Bacteroidota bacterium]
MKIVKKVLIVIAIIIAIPLVIALFVKKDYAVEREITINKPEADVFGYIRQLKNQDHFNKWTMPDPNMKREFQGTDGTVGFVYAWDSQNDKVGAGSQKITNITEGDRIDYTIHFLRPFEGDANTYMATEPVAPAQTKVKWAFTGTSNYPMNFMNLFIDNFLGKDLAISLNNLKGVLERS